MKNMKLIMENFRKNMTEMFGARRMSDEEMEDLRIKDPKMYGFMMKSRKSKQIRDQAIEMTVAAVEKDILDEYENRYDNVQTLIDDEMEEFDTGELKRRLKIAFNDNLLSLGDKSGVPADEKDMLVMANKLNILAITGQENLDDDLPSDQEDNPGVDPGEGGNY
jgi:hypothetical protein